jgi:hypothetical protein
MEFVILDMHEDENMSVILGRPFLNTVWAVIDCNKSKVTFHVNNNEHTVYFPKKQNKVNSINSNNFFMKITIGDFEFPLRRGGSRSPMGP